MKKILGLTVLLAALAAAGGCASQAAPHADPVVTSPGTVATSAAPAPAPSVAPSPDGTFQGACDYSLAMNGDNMVATATGDIEAQNTGNVGTVVRLKITWPQQGYAPLKMVKVVRVRSGASKDVGFHMPLTQTQITDLQSWQSGHGEADGCTYHGTIIHTFGSAS